MEKKPSYGSHIYCFKPDFNGAKRQLLKEAEKIVRKHKMESFQVTIKTRGPDCVDGYGIFMEVKEI